MPATRHSALDSTDNAKELMSCLHIRTKEVGK